MQDMFLRLIVNSSIFEIVRVENFLSAFINNQLYAQILII